MMNRLQGKIFNLKQDISYYKDILTLMGLEYYHKKKGNKVPFSLRMKMASLRGDYRKFRNLRDMSFLHNDFDENGSFKKKSFGELKGDMWNSDIQDPEFEKTFDYNVTRVTSPISNNTKIDHFEKRKESDPNLTNHLRGKLGNN